MENQKYVAIVNTYSDIERTKSELEVISILRNIVNIVNLTNILSFLVPRCYESEIDLWCL